MADTTRPSVRQDPGREATQAAPNVSAVTGVRRRAGVWQRFRRHRVALVGAVILLLLAVGSVGAPVLSGNNDPFRPDISSYRKGPDANHLLGTDSSGRDVWSRLLYAGRVSLSVGLVAVTIYTVIGVILGSISGFYSGLVDSVIMRLADVVLSFPALILIITVVSVLGPSIYNIMLVIGLLGWPPIARIVRALFLSLREREFVLASRTIGVPNSRIIFRHILPNAIAPVIVAATFGMANAILLEAGLSFLGLGVQPPTASWGNMLTDAQSLTALESMPWLWIPPGAMIALAVLSINFIGDGLRDALDPRGQQVIHDALLFGRRAVAQPELHFHVRQLGAGLVDALKFPDPCPLCDRHAGASGVLDQAGGCPARGRGGGLHGSMADRAGWLARRLSRHCGVPGPERHSSPGVPVRVRP